MMARPTTFNREIFNLICEHMSRGQTLREVCRDSEMPGESTVRSWAVLDIADGVAAQYARAREALAAHWADETVEIADDGTNDWVERRRRDGSTETALDREHVERSKLRVSQRNWLLARILPKTYGDRIATQQLDKEGNPTDPAPVAVINVADMAAGWVAPKK